MTARTLKLKGYTNALAYVRGVVPDKKPAAQLAASADAVEIVSDTLRSLEWLRYSTGRAP